MLTLYLAIAVVTIPLGAGIAFVSKAQPKHFGNIFGLTAGAVLGIVLVMMIHLYTEVGYATILVMWVGFLLISGVEYLTTHRIPDANERHIDNREHRWSVHLTVLGLAIHSLADGFNLVIAAREGELGIALAFGILIHRLPVGTLITVAVSVCCLLVRMSSLAPVNCSIKFWISSAANCSCSVAFAPIWMVALGSPETAIGISLLFAGVTNVAILRAIINRQIPLLFFIRLRDSGRRVLMDMFIFKSLKEVDRAKGQHESDDK